MVLGIAGTEFIGDFITKYSGQTLQVVLAVIIFILIAGGIGAYLIYVANKKKYDKRIIWFEETNGIMLDSDIDMACEIAIPNTNVRLFYIKKKDMYLPRLTRRMGKNTYWLAIRNNREIVNFTMKNINQEYKEAGLDYDHTDMRYASENLRKIIQEYRKNSQKWWQEYKDIIGLVILIFVMSLSFFFLLNKIGGLVDKIGALIDHADTIIKTINSGSGVNLG